ncbi:MAG: ABC transporter permease, partial [Planctomycetota bacterium]
MKSRTITKLKKYFSFRFIHEIIKYRELLYILVKRDINVRYRNTVLGIGWALIQPLLNSLIFVAVFYYFAKIPVAGSSPFAFYMSSLIPWFFFSTSLNRASLSLINHQFMITKVYFPKMILPLASCITTLYDSIFQLVSFILIAIILKIEITWKIVFIIPLFIYLFLLSFACSLWISMLSILY